MKKYLINKKLFLSLLLLSIILLLIQNFNLKSVSNIKEVKFIITPEYSNYLLGEPMWINVKIMNNTDSAIYFKDQLMIGFGLEFIIKDNSNKKLENILLDVLHDKDTIELLPGQVLENNVNLDFYSITNPSYLGKYKIISKFDEFVSNEVEIDISEPIGDEKDIYEFIMKEEKSERNFYDKSQPVDSLEKAITNFYPDSKYSMQIYEKLLTHLSEDRDSINFFEVFDSYMSHHKNKLSTINIVSIYTSFLKSYLTDNEIILDLNQLKVTYQMDESAKKSIERFIKLNFYNDKNWCKY